MAGTITLKKVEALASKLPPQQQLRLAAHISERLSVSPLLVFRKGAKPQSRKHREAMADELLAELDAVADSMAGEFDSAEDLRQIREERASRL